MKGFNTTYKTDDLLCGIDGGGTTTKIVVCTLNGQIVFSFTAGSINHYGAGTARVKQCFAGIAEKLMDQLGCIPHTIFAGNSALDGLASEEKVREVTDGVFKESKVIFHSDVYVTLLGFTMGKPGAVLISGTGSMACGIDAEGNYHTAGGWGQVLGDEGSGYHLALEGIKAGLRAHDGVSDHTLLTSCILDYFKLEKMSDLIDIIYHAAQEKSSIAAFAPEVEKAADHGDRIAADILESEANWLYQLARCICEKCDTTNLGYNGSVLEKNKTIRSGLARKLQRHSIKLHAPMFPSEIGALIGAFHEAKIALDEKVIENLTSYRKP